MSIELEKYYKIIEESDLILQKGKVIGVSGLVIEASGPKASIGEVCHIINKDKVLQAEVVGFRNNSILLMPLGSMEGITPYADVISTGKPLVIPVGEELLGRVIDGLGNPIDDKGPIYTLEKRYVYNEAPHPLKRARIKEILPTGVRAIDSCLTCGKGQRVGIFSGSGVGKSILLGMIARYCEADVNVIALVGERGREVREFLEKDLKEGIKKSVVVVTTSDKPAIQRVKGAFVATTIAEYFREKGLNVMLLLDSITRIAVAQREIGLAVGEPPTTKGYTPSVFALLPKLLERTGMAENGSITAFYTILVEQGDMDEPIADAVRAILDGHVVLSRKLADKNHYPAIDILPSISRLMMNIVEREHLEASKKIVEILATYKDAEDLINIGAYVKGANKKIDYAVDMIDKVNTFLQQKIDEKAEFSKTIENLIKITKTT